MYNSSKKHNGVVYIVLSERYGSWKTVHSRLRSWVDSSLFERLFLVLSDTSDTENSILNSTQSCLICRKTIYINWLLIVRTVFSTKGNGRSTYFKIVYFSNLSRIENNRNAFGLLNSFFVVYIRNSATSSSLKPRAPLTGHDYLPPFNLYFSQEGLRTG